MRFTFFKPSCCTPPRCKPTQQKPQVNSVSVQASQQMQSASVQASPQIQPVSVQTSLRNRSTQESAENDKLIAEIILTHSLLKEAFKLDNSGLKRLIKENRDKQINLRDSLGNTALHKAALSNNAKLAKQLIEQGADINAKDNEGKTALINAGWCGKKELIHLLIHKSNIEAKDKQGMTALISAAGTGNLDATAALIKNKANINAKEESGNTALMLAAENGNKELIELLIKNGANIDARNRNNERAIEKAKAHQHTDIVEILKDPFQLSTSRLLASTGK